LIDLASFREIGGVNYIKVNIRYKYDNTHVRYIGLFIIPLLILFLILIPLGFFLKLKLNEKELSKIKFLLAWGFIYHEYKINAYFWEFIKMSVRVLIIIVLSFYEDYVAIKGVIIYLII